MRDECLNLMRDNKQQLKINFHFTNLCPGLMSWMTLGDYLYNFDLYVYSYYTDNEV